MEGTHQLSRKAGIFIIGITAAVLLNGCADSAPASTIPTPPDLVVTTQDQNTTVPLALGQRFVLQLSNLNWNGSFAPAGNIQLVQGSASPNDIQGIYEAVKAGTTVLTAFGTPVCAPGQACAQFVVLVTITFNVGT